MMTVSEEGQRLVKLRDIAKSSSLFGVAVSRVMREFRVSEAAAINMIAKDAGEEGASLFNQWSRAGRPDYARPAVQTL